MKRDMCVAYRASRVDVKKLEKQEAKLKVGLCLLGGWGANVSLFCWTGQDRETCA